MTLLIETQFDLDSIADDLSQSSLLSIDCEFERRTSYFAELCLLQFKTSSNTYIIDCKKIKDLSLFSGLITSAGNKKILHASFQDLQIFYHDFSAIIDNFEDTQILANFCGFDQNIGYSRLVEQVLGVKVSKSMQNSNWVKRPLSDAQIRYAAIDVEYLQEIYTILNERNKFSDFYQQDKEHLIHLVKNPALINVNSFLKKYDKILRKKSVSLDFTIDVLNLRDQFAQKLNVPRRFLVSDEELLQILIERVAPNKVYDDQFVDSLDRAINKHQKTLDLQVKSCNNFNSNIFEKAKKLLADNCGDLKLLPQFVVSSYDLKEFLFTDNFFKKITKWRLDILRNIKKEVGL